MKLHAETKSWISTVYGCSLCRTLTWSDLNPPCIISYGLQAACRWWSVRSCCNKQEVRCRASLNLSRLRNGCQCCTLAVAQHCHASAQGRSIFGKYLNAHLKFTVYGRKHGRIHTHLDNAVPLVWGSLRLAPTKFLTSESSRLVPRPFENGNEASRLFLNLGFQNLERSYAC